MAGEASDDVGSDTIGPLGPLKKIRPAALHLMNSVFVIVLVD